MDEVRVTTCKLHYLQLYLWSILHQMYKNEKRKYGNIKEGQDWVVRAYISFLKRLTLKRINLWGQNLSRQYCLVRSSVNKG
jgi:hypothetical protein